MKIKINKLMLFISFYASLGLGNEHRSRNLETTSRHPYFCSKIWDDFSTGFNFRPEQRTKLNRLYFRKDLILCKILFNTFVSVFVSTCSKMCDEILELLTTFKMLRTKVFVDTIFHWRRFNILSCPRDDAQSY